MDEHKYKIFIPCAGTGSRLDLKYNKALVTVGEKPAIAHIIDKFPPYLELVIALGHDKSNVKQVVDLLYPNRKITYVYIDPYEGEDSGLGLTLLQSYKHLQCPFVFCSCDTIVVEDIPQPSYNWMGYSSFTSHDGSLYDPHEDNLLQHYRSIQTKYRCTSHKIDDLCVDEICSKHAMGNVPYIGLSGIYDHKIFWDKMIYGQDVGSIEMGEVFGLKYLLDSPIRARKFTWFDTGNPDSLTETRKQFPVGANILPKQDEAIWFVGDKVIKFSIDQNFIKYRVSRAKDLIGYIPQIISSTPNTYVYKKAKGNILSSQLTAQTFKKLLDRLVDFWQPVVLDKCHEIDSVCKIFYKIKTSKRIKQYLKTFEQIDQPENINGIDVPNIWKVLEKIDWDWLCNSKPTRRFHGDLHFENILINDSDDFIFLDWRQDFAGLLGHGDLYYDLAKLNHGILISHELVGKQLFSHSISNSVISFDFLRKNISVELEQMFKEFIIEQGYDYRKVQYLTYLIFLNCAALHHYPYGLLLFHLGKLGLWRLLEKDMENKNDTTN